MKPKSFQQPDYAIIVTAYQQTGMLSQCLTSLLNLNYRKYHIYLVADNCDISEISIVHPKVTILRPDTVLSSNVKSHFYAIDRFVREHDIVTIIDSDNLVHPEYINQLNKYFGQGFVAVQGKREAKNLDSHLSRLDAARDRYYHFFDGEVLFRLGSSSTLAGSGMAFSVDLYKECLKDMDIKGAGFDKVLQAELLKRNYRIASSPDAIVYDEKSSHSDQLVKQRSRWINTWFKYFSYGFILISRGFKNRSWNQLLFGTILLRPPIFIFLILSFVCLGVNFSFDLSLALIWTVAIFVFVSGFFVSLIAQRTSRDIYIALLYIPIFVLHQIVALWYSRIANKRSVATTHINLNTHNKP